MVATQVYDGQGPNVLDISAKGSQPALVVASHSGRGNCAIWAIDDQCNKNDLLVNVIGDYNGVRPIDLRDGEHSTRLQPECDGTWHVEVRDLITMARHGQGSVVTGAGDDVFWVDQPDLAHIVCTGCSSNFVVQGYSTTEISLMVNTIGAFDGVVVVPHGSGDKDFAIIERAGRGGVVLHRAVGGRWAAGLRDRNAAARVQHGSSVAQHERRGCPPVAPGLGGSATRG